MQSETNADYSQFFEADTITPELYDSAMDAAHSSYRVREQFESRLNAEPASSPVDKLRKGLGLLALGKYADALSNLESAADEAIKYFAAAKALTAQGKYENARNALAKAAEKGWDPLVCDMWTAELHVREQDLDAARKLIKKQESRGNDRAEWYYAQALVAEAELDRQTALEMFDKALKLNSDIPRVAFRAAYLFDLVGDEDRAIELYEKLTDRPRTHVNALINMAVIHEDQGDYEQAAHCLRRVLKGFPNHRRARQFLKDVESGIEMIVEEGRERQIDPRLRLLETPIAEFELSVRARNCLKKMNIRTLGELIALSEPELLAYKNFGETSLNEIKALLVKKGLRLGLRPDEIDPSELEAAAEESASQAPEAPKVVVAPEKEALLTKPVSDLELSVRSRRCLQRLNITTIGDLLGYTEADLLATRNFGQTSLVEIRERLEKMGLELATKA